VDYLLAKFPSAGLNADMSVVPFDEQRATFPVLPSEACGEESTKVIQLLTRHLIRAQEEERQKIAREIHQVAGGELMLLLMSLQALNHSAPSGYPTKQIHDLVERLRDLAKFLRDLSHSLYCPLLDVSGLVVASKSLCNDFKTRNGLDIKADIASKLPHLKHELALCLYRVLQESLQNIVKHAGRCNVNVRLKSSHRAIRLEVSDTGRGFATAAQNTGIGLLIMKERVRSLRGQFKICSSPSEGTYICVTIPIGNRCLKR